MTTNQNKAIAKDAALTGLRTLNKADMPTNAQRKRWQKEYKDAQGGALKLVGVINAMNTQPAIETASAQPENVRDLSEAIRNVDFRNLLTVVMGPVSNQTGESFGSAISRSKCADEIYSRFNALTAQRDELLKDMRCIAESNGEDAIEFAKQSVAKFDPEMYPIFAVIRNAEQQ